jgi:GTP cyclohydrolase I
MVKKAVVRASGSIEHHLKEVIRLIGLNPDEEGLVDTPKRIAKFLREFNTPFDPGILLGTGFAHETNGSSIHSMVVQSNIPFRGLCEHHFAPMTGRAAIGYVPDKKVIGLSKMARLVQAVGTERPSLQEAISERIADLFSQYVEPKGCIVIIKAEHSCMTCRGINTPGVVTTTSSIRGIFRDVQAARQEFFELTRNL